MMLMSIQLGLILVNSKTSSMEWVPMFPGNINEYPILLISFNL